MVDLHEGATAKDLKAAIEDREFIPANLQRLVRDSEDLTEEPLEDSDMIMLLMSVNAGMRAKWRKKRMRRLRRKRRKMRLRAR